MATSLEIALATKALGIPLQDIYTSGKGFFQNELAKWKNSSNHVHLARKLAKVQKVKTFWQRDKEVSIYSFFYPSPIDFGESVTKEIAGLSQFPTTGNFVIQGTVGQGKSIFMRHLCAQELGEKGSGRIPVFIELRLLNSRGLSQLIFDALDKLGFEISERLFDFYATTRRLVLLLDGFDEIDEAYVPATIAALDTFSEKYEGLQIIISSRPSSVIQNSRHFRIARLAPLRPADHPKFLKKIGLTTSEVTKIQQAITASSAEVHGLLTTPLMMTLLVVVYRAENAIPSELPDFYERLFQTLFSKHDSIKPGLPKRHRSGLGERKLQLLFEAFCFSVLQLKKKTTLSTSDFSKCYEQALKFTNIECDEDAFRHDISKAICLMQEEGFDLHFIHKSVLEFFAASFIRGLNDEAAIKFYEQMGTGSWFMWSQVLQFLSQIDKYRYSKYFSIPGITLALNHLGVDPLQKVGYSVENAMVLGLKDVEFEVGKGASNEPVVVLMQSPIGNNKFFNSCDTTLGRYVFDRESQPRLNFSSYNAQNPKLPRATVKWEELIEPEDRGALIESFRKYIEGLFSALREGQDYVDSEGALAQMIKI